MTTLETVERATKKAHLALVVGDLRDAGGLILEREQFDWVIEYEAGGQVRTHSEPADYDDHDDETVLVFFPRSRTVARVNAEGRVVWFLAGVIKTSQDYTKAMCS